MRRPFFSGNYGSALGSTANAANLIAQAGQAQGQMFANLGNQIGGAIEKYAQNKKEGEAADMQIGAILQNMTPERQQEIASGESELGKSLSKFIEGELPNSKKKALLGSLMTVNTADQLKRKEQMDAQRFQQQQELAKLNMQIARQNLSRQKDADQLAKEDREKSQTQSQNFNRFLQAGGSELLQTEQGQGIYNRMVQSGVNPQTALKNVQAFEQRIAQSQPKAPTINEQIALEKREEEVEEKTQQKESEEQQRQSLLAETNDILRIIESGKDVTGQVEGLDFVRALKKSVGYGKEDEKLRRKLERYANKFTLENVSKLKGPLSEKELAFIQQSSPKITDEPEVWVDFLTGLKDQLNTEGAGQIPQADPSAPASQSLLDEIERKKQLRSKRAGL